MLGKAPTRMVVWAKAENAVPRVRTNPIRTLFTLLTPDDHGQNTSLVFFLFFLPGRALAFSGAGGCAGDQVGQCSVFENLGGRVADVEKNLIESAMGEVAVNKHTELLGVGKGCEGTIDQTHDLAQADLGRLPAQLVAAFGATDALDHASVLQFEE